MGQALRRATGRLRSTRQEPSPESRPPSLVERRPPPPAPAQRDAPTSTEDRLDVPLSEDSSRINGDLGPLEERDPGFDAMLNKMVGRITSKSGGKPEIGEICGFIPTDKATSNYVKTDDGHKNHLDSSEGKLVKTFEKMSQTVLPMDRCHSNKITSSKSPDLQGDPNQRLIFSSDTEGLLKDLAKPLKAFIVEKYNRPMPKLRSSTVETKNSRGKSVPPGTLSVAQLQQIILLRQGKSDEHRGPMEITDIANKFNIESAQVEMIVRFVSLLPEQHNKTDKD